jgi:hypothetical protein
MGSHRRQSSTTPNTAVRAFTAAGPTDSPSSTPVSPTVARAVREALTALPAHAQIVLPAQVRVVLAGG